MVNYCTVYGCNSKGATPGVRFHRFPKQRSIIENWGRALRMQGRKITKWSVVCSKHFLPSDYRTFSGYRTGIYTHPPLKKDAVPSQNLPQLQRDASKLGSDGKSREAAANVKNRKEVDSSDDSDYEQENPPQSPNLIIKSDPDETNDVLCTCGFTAHLLMVKTQGLNCGRQFYKCGNTNSCHFFLWADDELLALRLAVQMNGVNENFTVACRCDNPAKLLTVQKDGPNSGRQFFGCEQSCGFFRWADIDIDVPATNNSFLVIKEECPSDNSEDNPNNSDNFSVDPEFDALKLELPSEDVSNHSLPEKHKRKRVFYSEYECPSDNSEDDPNNSDNFSVDPEFDALKLELPSEDVSHHSLPEKRKRKCVFYSEYEYPSDNSEDVSNNSGPVLEDANFDPVNIEPPEEVANQSVPEKPKRKCGLCLNLDHNRNSCPRNRSRRK